MTSTDSVFDTAVYPIHQRDTLGYQDVLDQVKAGLNHDGCATLKGLVVKDALEEMRGEATNLLPEAVYRTIESNAYFSAVPEGAPENDPRAWVMKRTNGMIPADQFDTEGRLVSEEYVRTLETLMQKLRAEATRDA